MSREGRDRPTAVVPTGFDPGSYSCVRSLSELGVRTVVASHEENVPAGASRFCDERVTIPSPHDDLVAYKDALVGLADRPDVETILPLRPHDPYVFAKYSEEFEGRVSLVTPPMPMLRAATDRIRMAEVAEDAGVPVPRTRSLDDVDDWDEDLVIKSRYNLLADEYLDSYAPDQSDTVKSVTHVRRDESPDLDAVCERMKHVPVAQEYVPIADEYVFGALYDRGEAVATFQHRQIRGDSYTGGGGVFRESIDVPELEWVGRTLLDALDWHGLACIEYMEHAETGEFVLTEINPRLWQSLPSAVHAGADFPAYYWHQATGRADRIDPEYEVGVGTHMLYGELGHLLSVLRDDSPLVDRPSIAATAWEILASCVASPHFDNLRLDDPRPFARGLRHVLTSR